VGPRAVLDTMAKTNSQSLHHKPVHEEWDGLSKAERRMARRTIRCSYYENSYTLHLKPISEIYFSKYNANNNNSAKNFN
jgi:hypothetical protein